MEEERVAVGVMEVLGVRFASDQRHASFPHRVGWSRIERRRFQAVIMPQHGERLKCGAWHRDACRSIPCSVHTGREASC